MSNIKKTYTKPEIDVTMLLSEDILTSSGDEVFIPGGDLFDDLFE